MAIGATAIWECRTTGSDNNGGFYTSGGTDYSQQNTAELTLADIVADGTTTLTSVTGGFTSAMVGNGIHLDTPDEYYEVATYVGGGEITVDRNVAANTGIAGLVGGASATLQEVGDNLVAGNTIYVKGNRTLSATPEFDQTGGSSLLYIKWIGYGSTRGDDVRVLIDGDGSAQYCFYASQHYQSAYNFDFTGATSGGFWWSSQYAIIHNCKSYSNGGHGLYLSISTSLTNCESYSNGGDGVYQYDAGLTAGCIFRDNTGGGIYMKGNQHLTIFCLYENNVKDAVTLGGSCENVWFNTIDAGTNGVGNGCECQNVAKSTSIVGNIITNFDTGGKYGITCGAAGKFSALFGYNCFYNNDENYDVATPERIANSDVQLTASPYNGADDFTLNNTAGAGAACKELSIYPIGVLDSLTTNYNEAGCYQEAYPSSATPTFGGITGIVRVGPGLLKATWGAGGGAITGYKIFVRKGSAPAFADDTYLWGIVDNTKTSVIIDTEEDNDTLFYGDGAVYVGVRAYNDGAIGAEDANTTTLNLTPDAGLMLTAQQIQVLSV